MKATGVESMIISRFLFVLLLSIFLLSAATGNAGVFGPSNCQECILENVPGTKNDRAATEIVKKCLKKHGNFKKIKKKSSFFGISTASECTIEYSKDTSSPIAAKVIQEACYSIYSE